MKKIAKITAIAALLGVSASASAWWGGPGYGNWFDEFFGDGFADFNMNVSTHTSGWGRGYRHEYYGPYGYGPYAYGPYGYPYATAPVAPVAPVAQAAQ